MSITIEQIEELRKRTSVGYKEAKILLEKHNGDVLEALIELEISKKLNSNNHQNYSYNYNCDHNCGSNNNNCYKPNSEHAAKLKNLWVKGNLSKFIVTRKGETIVKVPVNYLIVSVIIGFHLAILSLVLILATGCKMSIQRSTGSILDVDDAIIDMAQKVKDNAKDYMNDNGGNNTTSNDSSNNYSSNTTSTNNSSVVNEEDSTKDSQTKTTKNGGISLEKDYNEFTVE